MVAATPTIEQVAISKLLMDAASDDLIQAVSLPESTDDCLLISSAGREETRRMGLVRAGHQLYSSAYTVLVTFRNSCAVETKQ